MPTFPTPQPITLVLDLAVGEVTLVASDRPDTVVTLVPSHLDRPGDVKAAAETRVDLTDGTLTIASATRWRSLTKASVDLTVELPTGSAVQGSTAGSLFAQGRLGACQFVSRAGDIRVEAAGRLDLRAAAGTVVAGHVTGPASIVVSAGNVRVRELDGDAVIRCANGDTHVGRSSGALQVTGAHGNVMIESSRGSTTATSAYGQLRVEEAVAGTVRLETSYGAIEVGVPHGTAAWLDARSDHGTVRTVLDDAQGPQAGEQTVEVRAHTRFGGIVVRRPERATH